MLVLSRKEGESFFIGDEIEVFVLDVQGDRIKVGIKAPDSIKIIRKELKDIEGANLDSAASRGEIGLKTILKRKINFD
ncbi:Translational regulator CsrA [bioreactor metagenome]|uniref:Translational regulator CsrA n=1 Tax=bioreactor metagenome TaxID=1076179 RepID=A0A645CQG5_9ZZZZ